MNKRPFFWLLEGFDHEQNIINFGSGGSVPRDCQHVASNNGKKETKLINDQYRRLIEARALLRLLQASAKKEWIARLAEMVPVAFHILDSKTIAFADRRGNNRLDTLRNIVSDPHVALLFLIPGWNECLRINGRAFVTDDETLCRAFEFKRKLPATVVVVEIDTMYFQCARAIKRAGLWEAGSLVDRKNLPSTGELVKSTMPEFDAEEYDIGLQERQAKSMY